MTEGFTPQAVMDWKAAGATHLLVRTHRQKLFQFSFSRWLLHAAFGGCRPDLCSQTQLQLDIFPCRVASANPVAPSLEGLAAHDAWEEWTAGSRFSGRRLRTRVWRNSDIAPTFADWAYDSENVPDAAVQEAAAMCVQQTPVGVHVVHEPGTPPQPAAGYMSWLRPDLCSCSPGTVQPPYDWSEIWMQDGLHLYQIGMS
jgi:hypothetical protein